MIPALNRVGDAFEKKTLFLPQLLMSADAAKAGFEIIKKAMFQKGADRGERRPCHCCYGQRGYPRYWEKYCQGAS